MALFLLEIAIMAILIVYGLRLAGSVGGGVFAILGILIMVFIFRLPPGTIPVDAVYIILSIAISGGVLEITGGIDYLVSVAAKLIKKWPRSVTFISPLIMFVFVFGIGTSNIALALEPVISETAIRAGVRPRRPLVASVLAANFSLLCSPAAAATAYIISLLAGHGITMGRYMSIVVPTTLLSIVCLSIFETLVGGHKIPDKEYVEKYNTAKVEAKEEHFTTKNKLAALFFLLGVFSILAIGIFPSLQPDFVVAGKHIKMVTSTVVQMFMYGSAAINLFMTKVPAKKIFESKIGTSGFGALLAVLGPGWLGSTVFGNAHNLSVLKTALGPAIEHASWIMVLIILGIACLVISQAATSAIVYPLALSLGVAPLFLIATVQALNANFVIPAQPTILFAEDVDTTGSTHKYGFEIPGFFIIFVSFIIGTILITL